MDVLEYEKARMDFKRYFTTEKKENLTGPPSPIGCRSLNPRR